MSIIVQNVSKELRAKGQHDYELRINRKVIATFTHNREDGLATCLRKAADAAENPQRREVTDEQEFLRALFAATSTTTNR